MEGESPSRCAASGADAKRAVMGVWPADIFEETSVGCSGVCARKEELHGGTDACIGCAREEAVFSHPLCRRHHYVRGSPVTLSVPRRCRCLYHCSSAAVQTSRTQKRRKKEWMIVTANYRRRSQRERDSIRRTTQCPPASNAFPKRTRTHPHTHTRRCTRMQVN